MLVKNGDLPLYIPFKKNNWNKSSWGAPTYFEVISSLLKLLVTDAKHVSPLTHRIHVWYIYLYLVDF